MAAIFLSYAREDRSFAENLARVLEGAGHDVWWDRHIGSGREFAGEIETKLTSVDLVLVAWSHAAAKSPWVRDEAAIGRDRGRLLPVLVDGSEPPIGFRQVQALDLIGWKGRRNDRRTNALAEAVETVASGTAPDLPKPRGFSAWRKGNRPRFVAAALALVIAVAAGLHVFNATRRAAEPASLAVLPFKNMAAGDSYFAEGVAEEIASQLDREPQFNVAGRTSSALFKDAADLRDVGRRLHVAYVLEGSVRSAGNQVRVAVSLVDTRRGTRIWSQDFRGSLNDIFAIQDSIGQQVAVHVKKQLVGKGAGASLVTSGEVYRQYVTARSLMQLREPGKLVKAVDLLQRAVKLDPNYAPAWAELALATQLSQFYGHEDEPGATAYLPELVRQAERAIALAPKFARGHAVLGLLLTNDKAAEDKQRRGQAELERSVKLDPNDAEAWYWLHDLRQNALDFEGALDAVRRTAELDPFFVFSEYYPQLAWDMGDREGALRFLAQRASDHPQAYIREQALQRAAMLQHDWSSAYQHGKRAREIDPPDMRPYEEDRMAILLLRVGLLDQAAKYLPGVVATVRTGKVPPLAELGGADPLSFWSRDAAPAFSRLLINTGRAGDVVTLYDRAFRPPNGMRSRLGDDQMFVQIAPIAAAGLLEVGRRDEASQLVGTAAALCSRAMRKGRTPWDFQIMCTHAWAMLGRRDAAIQTLERAIAAGWRPKLIWSSKFTDEPAYKRIANDPRLRGLASFVLAENERERRELLAEGV